MHYRIIEQLRRQYISSYAMEAVQLSLYAWQQISYIATQVAIAIASYTWGNLDKDCNSIASRYSKYTEGYMEHVRSMKQRPVL